MIFRSPKPLESDLNEIVLRAQRLKSPRNYMIGKKTVPPLRPENVLIFRRNRRELLRAGSTFRDQHHRYVLITAVRGTGTIGIDTLTHQIEEGQSLLLLPFQAHWYESFRPGAVLWLFTTFEHGKDARLEYLRDRGAVKCGTEGTSLLCNLLRSWQHPSHADMLGSRLALWLHSLSQGMKRKSSAKHVSAPVIDGTWIAEINRLVFEDRESPLSLSQIAARLKVSASSLRSRFRTLAGKSLGKYTRELRLQYACELLHDTKLQISEVARRCGYDSVFSFSRAFRNVFAISPSHYRRTYSVIG